jgi:transcriptional regulator with XRE-family HTH domain
MQQHSDDPLLKQLGARIRTIRTELHLTQQECAAICQISRSHMCHLERGFKNASVLHLAKVAHGLGIELVDLFKP